MKKFLFLILFIMSTIGNIVSLASTNNTSSNRDLPINLDIHQVKRNPSVKRAPGIIDIEVYYNENTHTIEILYDGESIGEVFIYLDDKIVGYSSDINTIISLPSENGNYKIEIITDYWIAIGYIEL